MFITQTLFELKKIFKPLVTHLKYTSDVYGITPIFELYFR